MSYIYLASPYTHSDPSIMQARYEAVCQECASMIRGGHVVYSPIVHSHPLVSYGLPTEWDYWQRVDEVMLGHAGSLWVLMLDGWKESAGVRAEIKLADELNLPLVFIKPPA